MKEYQDDKNYGTSGGREIKKQDDLEDDGDEEVEKRETDCIKIENDEVKVETQQRVCPMCNKTFNSGKAFGGHMSSAHVQGKGQKNKSNSKPLMKRKYNRKHAKSVVGHADLVDEDGDYVSERFNRKVGFNNKKLGIGCSCCNRDFPSKKSLFGHMRCHPDRPYRGMDPPDCQYGMKISVNEEHGNNLVEDLVGIGWSGKGRRLRCSSSANHEIHEDDENLEERCMVANLLMHLHSSGSKRSLDDESSRVVVDGEMKALPSEDEGMKQSSNNEEAEAAGVINQHKSNGESIAILENDKDDNSSDDTKTDDELVQKLNYARKRKEDMVAKRKQKPKYKNAEEIMIRRIRLSPSSGGDGSPHSVPSVRPPPTPPQPPQSAAENGTNKEFRCSYCGKLFSTHQALGGHKSSHNKFKISIQNTIDDQVIPNHVTAAAMEDNNGDIQKTTCDESPSSQGRTICKKINKTVQKMLDFDLNQLPEEES